MPYLPYKLEEEQKKKEENLGTNISGNASTTMNQAQNASSAAPKPIKSGTWANIDAYLNANKDNAVSMGQTVGGRISSQGVDVRQGITDTTDDFNKKADKGTISDLDNAKTDAGKIIDQAKSANYGNQINDSQIARFNEISNAKYTGPISLDQSDYYQKTQNAYNKSQDYIKNSKSDEGRFNLLQEMFDKPTYTQGQKGLDNLLIQGNDEAKSRIMSAAGGLIDLSGAWNKAIEDADLLAGSRKEKTDKANEYARNTLSKDRSTRNGEVDSDLDIIKDKWNDEYDHYNTLLSGYKGGELELSKEEAKKLGVLRELPNQVKTQVPIKTQEPTNPQYADTQIFNILNGIAPSKYLDLKTYDANKVISKDQFAQLAALDKLGSTYGSVPISKFTKEDEAGTLGLHNNFDVSGFGKAASQTQTDFNDYSKGANFTGLGENTQSYQTGPFGAFTDSVTRRSRLDANLAEILKNGGYDVDNKGSNAPNKSILENPFGPLNDVVTKSLGSIVDGRGDLWRDGLSGAERDAQNAAFEQAKGSLFSQIMDSLNKQGFQNRIKVK